MDLAPLGSVDLSALRWTRIPGEIHSSVLMADETAIATLEWKKPHGSLAIGQTKEARWSLKRAGFLHAHLTVRREGSEKDVARLVISWRDHRIELSDGSAYDLKRASRLVPAWTISGTTTRTPLVEIEPVREGRRLEGAIYTVAPEGRGLPALPILLILSWYFVVLDWFEDETVAEWADHAEGRF